MFRNARNLSASKVKNPHRILLPNLKLARPLVLKNNRINLPSSLKQLENPIPFKLAMNSDRSSGHPKINFDETIKTDSIYRQKSNTNKKQTSA